MLKFNPFNIAFLDECISQHTEDPVLSSEEKGYIWLYTPMGILVTSALPKV